MTEARSESERSSRAGMNHFSAWRPRTRFVPASLSVTRYCNCQPMQTPNSCLTILTLAKHTFTNLLPLYRTIPRRREVGERRQIIVPSNLGYGNRGIGPIPPGSTLPGIDTSWRYVLPAMALMSRLCMIDYVFIMLKCPFQSIQNSFQAFPMDKNLSHSFGIQGFISMLSWNRLLHDEIRWN